MGTIQKRTVGGRDMSGTFKGGGAAHLAHDVPFFVFNGMTFEGQIRKLSDIFRIKYFKWR